jgi:hypothetical protein
MPTGLNYIKLPRSVTEYSLMKGITDFSNLKQFDVFEGGYSFLTVVGVPIFMDTLASKSTVVKNLQDGFVHILEGEFRGLSGIPDITADAGQITNGVNELMIINNVSMDTSITVEMTFWERSGGLITNYLNYYLTGIKDPYSKAKTYHGLVGSGVYNDPGAMYETFCFLYYVTDNTMRKIEKAYLLANAQPTLAPNAQLYNTQRGQMDFQEINLTFNCFPIIGDQVNMYAAMMLHDNLTTTDVSKKLVLDFNDYEWRAFKGGKKSDGTFNSANDVATVEQSNVIGDKLNREGDLASQVTSQLEHDKILGNLNEGPKV